MQIHDVSVPISVEMPTYEGDPGVEITEWAALARGDAANVTLLHFGAHTGTHVDAPSHFIEGAAKACEMPLEVLIGEARVVEIPDDVLAIKTDHLSELGPDGPTRILFRTRNSAFWSNPSNGFRQDFTYLEPDAARALVDMGVRLVGIDYLSVEKFKPERHETHLILLSQGVIILEGLDLREVRAGDYELICLPLKIASGKGDGAPARVILRTPD
ncbi:MAG TPA: cyclase family protein [Pyrinomonadaceae bacterium]